MDFIPFTGPSQSSDNFLPCNSERSKSRVFHEDKLLLNLVRQYTKNDFISESSNTV